MTRRTRTAALLSATTLLAGATFSLALAPSASADIPVPTLGTLSADPAQPVAGDLVTISGDGCLVLGGGGGDDGGGGGGGGGGDRPTTDPADPADPSAAPAVAAADDTPAPGTIDITITGPDDFSSGATATASGDGTWTAEQGITIGNAGDYTVDATCTLTDPLLKAQQVTFDYDSLPLTVSAPETDEDPLVTCNGCTNATPGSSVTVGGAQFPANTTATIALAGYDDKTSQVKADGGFDPVTIVIAADQAAGRIDGTVTAPGAAAVPFSVQVTVPEQPGGTNPDGDVPGDTDTSGTDGSTDFPSTDGTNYTSSAPTLPNTGADTVWPGVIGGLLVLSGGALLWAGRRREEADVTA